tara:strand:- start:10 stop:504 length:495 start_codon:yes stop_codon:yes gene_type:complete
MATFNTKGFLKHDDYMTPKYAWENIQQYIPRDKIIWEAFYGDGESGKILTDLGFNTIHKEEDFFNYTPEYDVLVSNPPFSKAKDIMDRLYDLDKPFILILPSSKINTQYFRKWKDKIQIIIPPKRIHFLKKIDGKTPDKWKNACNFDCFYYCYKMNLQKDIIWI